MPINPTGNNTSVAGIIPFGSSDESVLYQDSLKATPSNGSLSTGSVSHDSEKGMLLGSGGWMFNLSTFDFNSLESSGQISFAIEAVSIADGDATDLTRIGVDGSNATGNIYLMSWGVDGTTTALPHGFIFQAASNIVFCKGLSTDGTTMDCSFTDHIDSNYIVYTFSWIGNKGAVYANGALFKTGTFTTAADFMKFLHIGTRRGVDAGKWEKAHYIKDLVVSNRPVMMSRPDSTKRVSASPTHPSMAYIAFLGDSFANQAFGIMGVQSAGYQNRAANIAAGYLLERGVGSNFYSHGVSGTTIITTGSADISSQIAGALAKRPQNVICQGGTNDCNNGSGASYVSATFESDYKSHITTILASIKGRMFIGTVPTVKGIVGGAAIDAVKAANVLDANSIINSLPAWWDANNPADTGRVVVYDLFTETGGFEAPDKMISGLWWPLYVNYQNDLHLSSLGRYKFGRLLGKTLFNSLFS